MCATEERLSEVSCSAKILVLVMIDPRDSKMKACRCSFSGNGPTPFGLSGRVFLARGLMPFELGGILHL